MTAPDYEKHTASTDALDSLGTIIPEGEKRDAIHLAVEPAIAGDLLRIGQHVSIDPATNIAMPARIGEGVGIVDPFLTEAVAIGERFWLVVYPRQIESLRHVWEHPAFAPSRDTTLSSTESLDKAFAQEWLIEYLDGIGVNTDNFDNIIQQVVEQKDYIVDIDGDSHAQASEEFFEKVAIFVGHPVPHNPAVHFSCSC